ncbi:hypothetical protein ACQ4PT_042549 [Festuca glaucescens]
MGIHANLSGANLKAKECSVRRSRRRRPRGWAAPPPAPWHRGHGPRARFRRAAAGAGAGTRGLPPAHSRLRGGFAALLDATANTTEIFREHAATAAGTGGRLTVFCPNNLAVAAFEPKFNNLSADDQLAVVLYHGVTARYSTEPIAAFDPVAVHTLTGDAANNKSHVLTVIYREGEVWLWPASRGNGSCEAARVTMEVASGESTLAVYVIDRMLLPRELQQRLEGGDEAAAERTSYGDASS